MSSKSGTNLHLVGEGFVARRLTICESEVQELLLTNGIQGSSGTFQNLEILREFMGRYGFEVEVLSDEEIEQFCPLVPTFFFELAPHIHTKRELLILESCYLSNRLDPPDESHEFLGFVTQLGLMTDIANTERYLVNFPPRIPQERILYLRLSEEDVEHINLLASYSVPFYAVGIEKVLSEFQASFARIKEESYRSRRGFTLTCGEWGYRVEMKTRHIHSLIQICKQRIGVYGYPQLLELLRIHFFELMNSDLSLWKGSGICKNDGKVCRHNTEMLLELANLTGYGDQKTRPLEPRKIVLGREVLNTYREGRKRKCQQLHSLFRETRLQRDPVDIVVGFLFIKL